MWHGTTFRRTLLSSLILLAITGLVACGKNNNRDSTPSGSVSMSLTDGPDSNYSHVWITVKAVAFHTSTDNVWNASDATWRVFTLPAPVTIDLANLNNGQLNQLVQNFNLPAGTYRQIRLFLAGDRDTLTASALATKDSSNASLQWNDQVEYLNASTFAEAPLKIADAVNGIQLNGTFAVAAGSTLNLAVDFDLSQSVVPVDFNGKTLFAMRPAMQYFDLSQVGAITGKVDPASLCTNNIPAANCAYNLVVKAEALLPGGWRHYDIHATRVRSDGTFVLYPLWLKDANGNPLTYDVLIRGRQMNTKIITNVPVSSSTPGTGATALQTSGTSAIAIPLTVNGVGGNTNSEYFAQFSSALSPLSSGFALFNQTLPATPAVSSPLPYEVRVAGTDPFTGKLLFPEPLQNGPIEVANYNAGGALTFASTTPQEGGNGNYSVATNETLVQFFVHSNNITLTAAAANATTTFAPASPTLNTAGIPGLMSGSASGTITLNNPTAFNHLQLVVVHLGSVVTTQDLSASLPAGSINYTINNLPAGLPGTYYFAFVRAWNSSAATPVEAIVPILNMIDLRNSNSVTGINVILQ